MNNELYEPPLRPGYQGKGTIVYEPLSALSLTQRLGRLRFACYQLCASLIAGLLVALTMLFSQQMIPGIVGQGIGLIFIIVLAIYLTGLMVRRLHDVGNSGWWALLGLLPVANLGLMLYLFIAAGSNTVNRYGTPNPPPGPLVMLAGGLYWLLNVLGLVLSATMLILAWQAPEQLAEYLKVIQVEPAATPWN